MKIAPRPSNEILRQQALEKYQILNSLPEDSYNNITRIIAAICDTPIALISLIGNETNFFKSRHGIDLTESPRDLSFCSHTIISDDDIMMVNDARKDDRFVGNPAIEEQNTIFYAGVPLIDKEGFKLGTLCVFDGKPRELNETQIDSLKSMAKHVMLLFDERLQNFELKKIQEELEVRNQELKDFAGIVTHDLKTPLAHISMISQLLAADNKDKFTKDSMEYLELLENAGFNLSRYIDGMLLFYQSDELVSDELDDVNFTELVEDIIAMTGKDAAVKISYSPKEPTIIKSSKAALHQILLNFVNNSIKYGDKKTTRVSIDLFDQDEYYSISVSDNGRGIPQEKIDHVFNLFYTADEEDRHGNKGTGIGLATVKKLLGHLDGTFDIQSEVGKGTNITIFLPKFLKQ
ncbi:GAF sensor signal transduction histidine kinase [Nonlabens sp. Hel1_33_55]|uniref:sensor histidine kinase n=1 Tax=Nonlabens sp. Hel1_33_55 TaxID=1336802 RepID=UPI000875DDD8|nr:GAF domain-containing sensor histidine kinase [Nonlabens sp. Hel1_33_55]SCY03900.1 GAF sensor signal transduction histidine kinase [Nonlabens sp. Hel1_33_55]